MRLQVIIIFLLSLIIFHEVNAGQDTSKTYSAVIKFDPERDPEHDLKEAVVEAKKTNRRIILDVGGEWCIWCHRIDSLMNDNNDISTLLHNNFVVVKVNYSPENENKKFLSKYPKISGYPHFFVLNKKGKFIHSQDTGGLEEGKGYDKQKFISFLNKWK